MTTGRSLVAFVVLVATAHANTYTVTNTSNAGAGSLRDAIKSANGNSGPDTITFNLSGTAPFVIKLTSALPNLSGSVVIDGTSQPGYAGSPLIELDGSSISGRDGFTISASDCTIEGLSIHNFKEGVRVSALRAVVSNCWLGVDASGSTAKPNGDGVYVDASDCQVLNCVLSGNTYDGARVTSAAAQCVVQYCTVGLDASGTVALRNGGSGIDVYAPDGQFLDDTVSSNAYGISLNVGAKRSLVQRVNAGTNSAGTNAKPNMIGVYVGDTDCQVLDCLLSGNVYDGLTIDVAATACIAQGNLAGVDVTGSVAIPNGDHGITVDGTDAQVLNCVVSGNSGEGLHLNVGADRALVQDNILGLDATATFGIANPVGVASYSTDSQYLDNVSCYNYREGIFLGVGAADNLVQGNVIAFNGGNGVGVVGPGDKNEILVNSIHDNGGLGIALLSGANNNQTPPALLYSNNRGRYLDVVGAFNGVPLTTYHIEFFVSSDLNWSEGEVFLGSVDVTTDATGHTPANLSALGHWASGLPVTATATDPLGNTSQFSAPVYVDVIPQPKRNGSPPPPTGPPVHY